MKHHDVLCGVFPGEISRYCLSPDPPSADRDAEQEVGGRTAAADTEVTKKGANIENAMMKYDYIIV